MKKTTGIFCALAALFSASCCSHSGASGHALPEVDLSRYAGKWYEVARFENFFQHGLRDCSAVYELMPDGRVRVVNSGTAPDGSRRESTGIAYVPNPAKSAELRVSFFRPFYSDYIVLARGGGYEWSLVGASDKKYLWILSRTPTLLKPVLAEILGRAEKLGYDVKKLVYNAP